MLTPGATESYRMAHDLHFLTARSRPVRSEELVTTARTRVSRLCRAKLYLSNPNVLERSYKHCTELADCGTSSAGTKCGVSHGEF